MQDAKQGMKIMNTQLGQGPETRMQDAEQGMKIIHTQLGPIINYQPENPALIRFEYVYQASKNYRNAWFWNQRSPGKMDRVENTSVFGAVPLFIEIMFCWFMFNIDLLPVISILGGGFNPFEQKLVQMDHFPKQGWKYKIFETITQLKKGNLTRSPTSKAKGQEGVPALSAVSKDVSACSERKKWLPKSAVGVDQLLDTEKNNKLKVVYSNKTHFTFIFEGLFIFFWGIQTFIFQFEAE